MAHAAAATPADRARAQEVRDSEPLQFARFMEELAPLLPEGCLVMDLGSTKAQIVTEMAKLPSHVQPLGGHPMCGKETSGIEVADPAVTDPARADEPPQA